MSKPEKEQVTFRLDYEVYRAARVAAALRSMSIPQYVQEAIEERLASEIEQDQEQIGELVDAVRSNSTEESESTQTE